MTITSIQYQKKNPNRVSVFVDDEYSFSAHIDLITKYKILKGEQITEEKINEIKIVDIKNRVYDRTISYLSRGLKSEFQIRIYIKKLLFEKKDDWYESEDQIDMELIIDTTVEKLRRAGYINDENFAFAYGRTIVERKAVSRYYLSGKLREKGIDPKLADQVVSELLENEEDHARRSLIKKYRTDKIKPGDQKKISFLQRKGFSWDLISKLIG